MQICRITKAAVWPLPNGMNFYRLFPSVLIANPFYVQPVLGLLRPHKGNPLRLIWYFLHWLLGTTAVILAWVNIYWGLDQYRLLFGNGKTYRVCCYLYRDLTRFSLLFSSHSCTAC
jgi:hypothetical protein